jgi:thiol:disulfide interchange protein DsbD
MTYMRRWIVVGAPIVVGALFFADTAHANWLSDLEAPFRAAMEEGSFGMALVLVFAAGLATSLTPCVYPMIAITVSVFGARQAESRLQGALLSTSFVLGIAALFTPLGILAAVTGGVFGALLSNPWVLGAMALLFIALALSMFGLFEMNLPPSLQNRLAQVGGIGYKGAFGLGFVAGLIAAPCTGPVLAFLLAWIGTTGNVAFGGVALFVYALGLGLLFFVVGTFAVSLPKSGRWLEWVKSAFGTVMIVMAVYYLKDLLPFDRPVERVDWLLYGAAGLLVVGLGVGAIHLSYHDSSWLTRVRKTGGIAMAVAGATLAIWWLEALPPGAKIDWLEDYAEAQTLARAENRPLLVDFGASWCGACGELDRHTFSDPRVVAAAQDKSFVPVRVDLSPGEDTPEKREVLASYNQRGLPLVVLHDRDGEEVARVTAFMEADQFLQLMEAVD